MKGEVAGSESTRRPRQLHELLKRFLFWLNGLLASIVDWFSKPMRPGLESENNTLREMMESQMKVFTEVVSRHELLLERILSLKNGQELLRQEEQRLVARANALEKDVEVFKTLISDQTKQASSFGKFKNMELCEMKERYHEICTEIKDLKNLPASYRSLGFRVRLKRSADTWRKLNESLKPISAFIFEMDDGDSHVLP